MKDYEHQIIKIQAGDEELKQSFILKNMKLIYALVNRFPYAKQQKEDLIQVGCIGMMKAIYGFDTKYQVAFSTYAVPIILGEIKHYLRNDQKIHVSRNMKELYFKIIQCKEQLVQKLNKDITYQDIASELHLDVSEVIVCLEVNQSVVSMDEMIYDEQGKETSRYDMIASKDHNIHLKRMIKELYQYLTNQEQMIIYDHYHLGYTQCEIAKKLNISQVQVSRMIKKALVKMRNHV